MKDLGPPSLKARGFPSSPSVGREGSDRVPNEDAQESPVPSTRGTETGEAIPLPVLGGREAARLTWTAEGPTGTVESRTRGDVRRLQALHGAALVAREMGTEAAFEDSVLLAADIAFQMETQKITNFLYEKLVL